MLDTRSKRGADISSDHQLVVNKIKLKLKKNTSKSIKRIKFDVKKQKQKKWQEEFEKELHNKSRKIENSNKNNKETIEEFWENFKTVSIETAQNTIQRSNTKMKSWITGEVIQNINDRINVKQKFFFVLIVFISAYYKCTYHLIQSRLKQAINDLI